MRFAVLIASLPAFARAQGKPVRIGSTLPLTGPLAALGDPEGRDRDVLDELNSRGGLLGRKVEWVLKDDQSRPDLARTLYEQLITVDKVDLLMGPYAHASICRHGRGAALQQDLCTTRSACPSLAKYDMQFSARRRAVDPETVGRTRSSTRSPPAQAAEDDRHRHQQVPVGAPHLGRARASSAKKRGLQRCWTSSRSSATATSARSPSA